MCKLIESFGQVTYEIHLFSNPMSRIPGRAKICRSRARSFKRKWFSFPDFGPIGKLSLRGSLRRPSLMRSKLQHRDPLEGFLLFFRFQPEPFALGPDSEGEGARYGSAWA